MTIYQVTKPQHYLSRLHDSLPRAGGIASDYYVEGTDGPDAWVRVTTDVVDETTLQAVIAAHNSLTISSDKAVIQANGVDTATITCSDTTIVADAALDYQVHDLESGSLEMAGTLDVVSGTATLLFTSALAGTYLIELSRQGSGHYETGYIEVEAH